MYIEKQHFFTGKTWDTPKIHWNAEDKYAIIAFLLMSIDKKADENGKLRLDDLFGLNETVPEPGGGEGGGTGEKREARDAVVRECEKFLDSLHEDGRYAAVRDDIDKFIEGEDGYNLKCTIGDSYRTFGGTYRGKLEGGNYRLWDLVKLVVFDGDYNGNKRRLLKHLARKWDIDGSVLPALEDTAKTLSAITRERRELTESDKPFREVTALLLELETREKDAWKKLEKLGVDKDRDVSAIGETMRGMTNATLSLVGMLNPDFKAALDEEDNDEEEDVEGNEDEEEYEEPGIGEKIVNGIGDGICFGIEKATDIVCAPFEWMTDKLMGL
jgi:hypothetical protein